MSTCEAPSASAIAREVARRLREGVRDEQTIAAAATSLDVMASLYEWSRGVLAKAVDAMGRVR